MRRRLAVLAGQTGCFAGSQESNIAFLQFHPSSLCAQSCGPGDATVPHVRMEEAMDRERVLLSPVPSASDGCRLARWRRTSALTLAATGWLGVASASADVGAVDLGSLLARSEMVAIGKVTTVTAASGASGLSKASIFVEENLKGTTPGTVEIGFDANATEAARFAAGSHVVLFLRRVASPPAIALADRMHGAMETPPAKLEPARAILRQAIQAGSALRLSAVRTNLLRASGEPPRTLVGSLLRWLGSTLTSSDATLVTEMACDARNEYLPAARLWAMRQAGAKRLAAARPCLEAVVSATDLSRRLAASEALGNLRDPRSVAVLGSVLDNVIRESADGTGRPADGGLTVSLVLALGKIRDPAAVPRLSGLAAGDEDLALHSTVVRALGLIGGAEAVSALTTISTTHPSPLVRELARQTLARLAQGRTS